MGPEDWVILDKLRDSEPEFHKGVCIDAGSRNMNGSVSFFLGEEVTFIGIDEFEPSVEANRCITWQGKVHEYPGSEIADMVTCFNTFEHDYYWKESVQRLMELLKPGGLFIFQLICSGDEHGNVNPTEPYGKLLKDGTRHYGNMDPDEFTTHLSQFPVKILDTIRKYEGERILCPVDRWSKKLPTPKDYVLTRKYVYLIGRKL